MSMYRIHILDSAGRTVSASDAECSGNERAMQWAALAGQPGEAASVWLGGTCLGTVHGAPDQTAEATPPA